MRCKRKLSSTHLCDPCQLPGFASVAFQLPVPWKSLALTKISHSLSFTFNPILSVIISTFCLSISLSHCDGHYFALTLPKWFGRNVISGLQPAWLQSWEGGGQGLSVYNGQGVPSLPHQCHNEAADVHAVGWSKLSRIVCVDTLLQKTVETYLLFPRQWYWYSAATLQRIFVPGNGLAPGWSNTRLRSWIESTTLLNLTPCSWRKHLNLNLSLLQGREGVDKLFTCSVSTVSGPVGRRSPAFALSKHGRHSSVEACHKCPSKPLGC